MSVSFTERGELRGIRTGLKSRRTDWGELGELGYFPKKWTFIEMDIYNYNVIKMTQERIPSPN